MPRILACLLFASVAWNGMLLSARAEGEAAATDDVDARLLQLIGQLGSTEFAVRQKAQGELERLGILAFDALHAARGHSDPEIALRARYLLLSLKVDWAHDDDAAEVKRILRGYHDQPEDERKLRIDRLARVEDGQGVRALCRIIRFEPNELLSKTAALKLINHVNPVEAAAKQRTAATIAATVGPSKRAAATWARAWQHTLEGDANALAEWDRIVQGELETFSLAPEKSSREIARDLVRWHADYLRQAGKEAESLAAMRRTIELLQGQREDIVDTIDWAITRQAWGLVDEIARRYPAKFEDDIELLYRLAETQQKQQRTADAEKTAEKALKTGPDRLVEHVAMGYKLQERGLIAWAEREWRQVIAAGPPGSLTDLRSRIFLSELLHDQTHDLGAAEVLQGAVDLLDKDEAVRQTLLERIGRDPGGIRSRMHYFYAEHVAAKGDRKQQIERLEKGLAEDPQDADVLIAMYRLPNADAAFQRRTREAIAAASNAFREEIDNLRQLVDESTPMQSLEAYELATNYNQFAWLIGNTEGDFDEAVRFSHKSLELRPEAAGYLDTLAHCYFAKKDFENAVKYQSQAVKLEPHSGQIRRKLEHFQQALEASKQGAKSTDPPK